MFGLSLPRVQRAIEALPGAARCDRYCGWPEGEQPEPAPMVRCAAPRCAVLSILSQSACRCGHRQRECMPRLCHASAPDCAPCFRPRLRPQSEREQRERLACEARMQRLPEGVAGVPVAHTAAGVCHVCNEEEEEEDDLIVQAGAWLAKKPQNACCWHPPQQRVPAAGCPPPPLPPSPSPAACCAALVFPLVLQCNKCHVFAHMSCYGVREPPHGALWLCDVCSLNLRQPPPCALCPGEARREAGRRSSLQAGQQGHQLTDRI